MKGSCLCGSVIYEITPPFKLFQYCHCSRCRKFSGSAQASNLFVPSSQFEWLQGQEFLGRFEPPGTKYYASTFCKNCGSSLPWLVQGGGMVVVPAGTLDEDPEIRPQQNIFWESKAAWFVSPCELPQYAELPQKK